jgi:hypothetical protein
VARFFEWAPAGNVLARNSVKERSQHCWRNDAMGQSGGPRKSALRELVIRVWRKETRVGSHRLEIELPFFVRSGVNKIGTKPNDSNDYRKARPDQQPYTRLACVKQQKHSSKNADNR